MRTFGSERANQEGGERKFRLRSVGTWLGGLMVVGLILVGVGSVAAQTSSQVITGCIQKQTNVLEVLTSGSCDPKNETEISWNQVGPQGAKGDTGAPGPAGPQGPQGVKGDPGISGYEVVTCVYPLGNLNGGLVTAPCPSGEKVIGGGANGGSLNIEQSYPGEGDDHWTVKTFNPNFVLQ